MRNKIKQNTLSNISINKKAARGKCPATPKIVGGKISEGLLR